MNTDRNLGKSCNFGLLYGQSACGGKADYPDGAVANLGDKAAPTPYPQLRCGLFATDPLGSAWFARNKYGVISPLRQQSVVAIYGSRCIPSSRNTIGNVGRKLKHLRSRDLVMSRTLGVGRIQYFMAQFDAEGNVIRPLLKHQVFTFGQYAGPRRERRDF